MKTKIFSIILLAVICVSLVALSGCNIGASSSNTNTNSSGTPVTGNAVGNLCPGFELEIFDENGLSGEKLDPSKTGKVTVINFWGTWCTSCVAELPYFDEVATEYKDNVTVVAVHTVDSFNTAPNYVKNNYKDSDIVFVKDEDGDYSDAYYALLGGAYGYPFTVILDENGVITYKMLGSVTKDSLVSEVEKALNN